MDELPIRVSVGAFARGLPIAYTRKPSQIAIAATYARVAPDQGGELPLWSKASKSALTESAIPATRIAKANSVVPARGLTKLRPPQRRH